MDKFREIGWFLTQRSLAAFMTKVQRQFIHVNSSLKCSTKSNFPNKSSTFCHHVILHVTKFTPRYSFFVRKTFKIKMELLIDLLYLFFYEKNVILCFDVPVTPSSGHPTNLQKIFSNPESQNINSFGDITDYLIDILVQISIICNYVFFNFL